LHIVQHKRDELNLGIFGGGGTGRGRLDGLVRSRIARKHREKIAMEDETENQQKNESTYTDMASAHAGKSAAAFTSPIFNVVANSARLPFHAACSAIRGPFSPLICLVQKAVSGYIAAYPDTMLSVWGTRQAANVCRWGTDVLLKMIRVENETERWARAPIAPRATPHMRASIPAFPRFQCSTGA
jgi:hypothetical protein